MPDPFRAARRGGQAERRFIGDRTDDERGDVIGIPETDSGLVSGVGGLDQLVGGSEILANDDVDVLLVFALGFLRVAHVLLLDFLQDVRIDVLRLAHHPTVVKG